MNLRPLGSSLPDEPTPEDSTSRPAAEVPSEAAPEKATSPSPGGYSLKPAVVRPKLVGGETERADAKPKKPIEVGRERLRPIVSQEETVEARKVPADAVDNDAEDAAVLASLPNLRPKLSLAQMQEPEAVDTEDELAERTVEPPLSLRPKAPSAVVPPMPSPPAEMTIRPRGTMAPPSSPPAEMTIKPRQAAPAQVEPEAPVSSPAVARQGPAAAAARRQAERPKANLKLQRQANAHKIDQALLDRKPVVVTNPRSPSFNLFGAACGYLFAAEIDDDELRSVARLIREAESPTEVLPAEATIMPMAAIRVADLDPRQFTLDIKYVLEDSSEGYLALPGSSMKEMNDFVNELGTALQQTHRVATTATGGAEGGSGGWPALIGGLAVLAATGGAMFGVSRLDQADPEAEERLLDAVVSIFRDSLGLAGIAIVGGVVTLALCGYGLWRMVRKASAARSHTKIVAR